MKKKQMAVWISLVLIAGIFVAWRIGYSTRKSNDHLPALTSIAQMSEAEVNDVLPGYQIAQLREVWGEPDESKSGEDRWQIGNITLVVNYKNNGVVAICGLKDENGLSVGEESQPPSFALGEMERAASKDAALFGSDFAQRSSMV